MDQLAEYSCSHFCHSTLITRESAGRAQLVTLLLLSTHHPWNSWQSTAGQTLVTLHSSSVGQLAEHSLSHFGYSSLMIPGSAGRAQLVTLRLLSTHHPGSAGRAQIVTLRLLSTHNPWISCNRAAAHISVTLHSSSLGQLAEYSWSHFYYSPLITRGSCWQSTYGHPSVTLHSSPVDHLAEHSWSHFCYSPLITHGSAGRVQLVKPRLLSTHHP